MADSPASPVTASTSTEPLYQVKLLAALRSGDPALIHPFLAEIGKDKRNSVEGDLDTGAAALHLAIRCGTVNTVALLLSHRAISPNGVHPPGSGTTALHLAASLGRVDIVNLLLEQDSINDTLRDRQGRTCRDVAKNRDVVRAINDSHSFLNASYRSLLHSYVHSPPNEPPPQALLSLLDSPRIRFVDLSYLDDDSGTSLLHEAARRKDLRLIELAVRAGADVFVRDRRGKMPYDGAGKDDKVRVFLRQYANHDTTLIDTPASEPPTLRGYLNKYTNVAKGYNTRWFVLKNGVLSYYRHQEDETVASRGSISMKTAVLKTALGNDRLRFEVHSTPSRGHHSIQKWYMKANHPVEASRWTQAIGKSIEWYKQRETTTDVERRKSMESDSSGLKSTKSAHSQHHHQHAHKLSGTISRFAMKHGHPTASDRDRDSLASSRADLANVSLSAAAPGPSPEDGDASPSLRLDNPDLTRDSSGAGPGLPDDGYDEDGEMNDDDSADSGARSAVAPPYDEAFDLHANTTMAQLELTSQLLSSLPVPPDASARFAEVRDALKDSFAAAQGMVAEYVQMAREREEWWRRKVRREEGRQRFWEESLATAVREGEDLERELRTRSRRRGSRFFDASLDGLSTARRRQSSFAAQQQQLVIPEVQPQPAPPPAPAPAPPPKEPAQAVAPAPTVVSPPLLPTTSKLALTRTPTIDSSAVDTDEEDEFFDAIESGTLPNLIVNEALVPSEAHPEKPPHHESFDLMPYKPYKHLRRTLKLAAERPPTSLWSVLKHSIGKDLTRISFPVFFNEPTSMLQRMAEDMEFSECLDAAANEEDSLRRLAFVAAFAMSNYSSTIGRIAKPFNPMLSETFEYVRVDKDYRYVSEQVSHHPPISACWAESPLWHYFGEVDAQNKFMGKSFEIRPTGVAHAELLLPKEWAPDYPAATGVFSEGKVVEHYTWKKVTTNVSGFILGSPTIDHYGDMIITNHRTGDQCVLTFKPRGWRGRDAYEIAGHVFDSTGQVAYDIAGRWNSQLIAREASGAFFNPDMTLSGSMSSTSPSTHSPPSTPHHFLLWKNSDKPSGTPFNLTPFAITLNDCPPDLKPFLCPTDCRLRPDQRAFELGRYQLANELKGEQEEKQRTIRRAREEGRMPPHRPRWFRAETDGDTGERVWAPSRLGDLLEYWVEREKVFGAGGNPKAQWKDVERIFIDAPEIVK